MVPSNASILQRFFPARGPYSSARFVWEFLDFLRIINFGWKLHTLPESSSKVHAPNLMV
jgi:hypothetical protein